MVTIHPIASYLHYLITDCYEEDYEPFYAESWFDNFFFQYTFSEWYFIYRKRFELNKNNKKHYQQTPTKLIIGSDIFEKRYILPIIKKI